MKNELITFSTFDCHYGSSGPQVLEQTEASRLDFKYISYLFPQLFFHHFPLSSNGNTTDSFTTGESKTNFSTQFITRVVNKSGTQHHSSC